jgi:hypothetical protein
MSEHSLACTAFSELEVAAARFYKSAIDSAQEPPGIVLRHFLEFCTIETLRK